MLGKARFAVRKARFMARKACFAVKKACFMVKKACVAIKKACFMAKKACFMVKKARFMAGKARDITLITGNIPRKINTLLNNERKRASFHPARERRRLKQGMPLHTPAKKSAALTHRMKRTGLPRRFAPRNDDILLRRRAPRNDAHPSSLRGPQARGNPHAPAGRPGASESGTAAW
ncbi:MAG: hypothetical protein LBE06_11350, partial [Azoarcus sp.]|nr:hypothetical protein [Azoarcus sp.]